MVVVKVVDQDVADKVDTHFIQSHFSALKNVGIVFVCTSEGGEEDDWAESGIRYFVIHLPYKKVKKTPDIKALMLDMVKERLGALETNL